MPDVFWQMYESLVAHHETLWWLICGHALADFTFQTPAMASGKNWNTPIDLSKIPPGQKINTVWPYWMTSHCLIHGGMVALITGSVWLGFAEFVVHFAIDCMKCANVTNIHADQAFHVLFKMLWWAILYGI